MFVSSANKTNDKVKDALLESCIYTNKEQFKLVHIILCRFSTFHRQFLKFVLALGERCEREYWRVVADVGQNYTRRSLCSMI